ncbi:MAG TPA: helix-hairpin-helix domain-containing protein [bacterium]|nr:helix-hairpin-helix domain-containing protein [bacterium]HPN46026.1 helix-hairpin-helix domain-containing protein [bacterium]
MNLTYLNKPVLAILCVLGLTWRTGHAQEIDVERLFETPANGDNINVLLDYLQNLQEQPLDLNRVSGEELEDIPWITKAGAQAIIQYRRQHREFRSVDELDNIPVLEPATALIKTFFMVKQKTHPQFTVSGRHRFITDVQKSRAYKENIYAGKRAQVYHKINGSLPGQCRFALVTEKDPGEKSYYDYCGGYGEWLAPRLHGKLVIGNFYVESGQGLVHHGYYQKNKGYEPIMAATPAGRGIKGSASVAENSGYRGGGVLTGLGKVELAVFYSNHPLDAHVENDTIVSFQSSGYHRYGSEIKNRDSVTETVYGGYIKWPVTPFIYLGLQGLSAATSKPFIVERPATRIAGTSYSVYSMDYGITRSGWQVFGECAQSNHSGFNHLHSILFREQGFEYLVLWRDYRPGFLNRHGCAFGANDDMVNETGLYSGWKWQPTRKTSLACYYDHFKQPYYDNSDLGAIQYQDVMVILEHKFNPQLAGMLRGQWRSRDEMVAVEDNFGNLAKKIITQKKFLLRAQVDYQFHTTLQLRSRFEYHNLRGVDYGLCAYLPDSSAVMLYHDLHYKIDNRFNCRARWIMFDSPLYDTAFYLYENDLPGVMRMKMLYRRGSRWYFILNAKITNSMQITAKYEQTVYDNIDSIGSGYDRVSGNHTEVFSLQFDWRL